MHFARIIAVALAALLPMSYLAGCAPTQTHRATGQVIDDSAITARVKTALIKEAGLGDTTAINVDTYRGVVQLSGFVESAVLKQRAEQIARGVQGVESVDNALRIAPPPTGGTSAR